MTQATAPAPYSAANPPPPVNVELCLYKIADSMQMPLSFKDNKVSGGGKITINMDGQAIPLNVKPVKHFASTHFGVLFHVRRDLYLIVCYYQKTQTVSMFVLDKSKITMDGVISPPELVISKNSTLQEVVAAVRPGIVKSFFYKGDWTEMVLP